MFLDQRAYDPMKPGTVLDLYPQFRIPGRYQDLAIRDLEALAKSENYNWTVMVAPQTGPAGADPSTVAASDSVEFQFTVVPGSMLWGLTSVSNGDAGAFRFEIWDMGHPTPVMITKATSGSLSGDINASAFAVPSPFIFTPFYPITGTGTITVRITNLASVPNALQLAMFIAQPKVGMEEKCRAQ